MAWLAGCPYTKINSKESLGLTAVFNVAGVDKSKFLNHVEHNPKRYSDWGDEWVANADKEKNLKSPYLELPNRPQYGTENHANNLVGNPTSATASSSSPPPSKNTDSTS